MNLLNACLALVLTLGVFASVVTVLVEMIYQTLQQRAKDLQGMLGFVFDAVFSVEKGLQESGLDMAGLRQDFTQNLRRDQVLDVLVQTHSTILKKIVGRRIANDASMTLETFFRRLDRSTIYKIYLKTRSPEEQEKILMQLADQFSRAEKAISEFFRVRAKLVSFLVGIGLTIVVNVDAVRLFEYFSANPVATEATITRLQGVLAEAGKAPSGKRDSDGGADSVTAAVPTTGVLAQGEMGDENASAKVSVLAAEQDESPSMPDQRQEIEAMLDRLRNSQALGLPVGWAYYPYCIPQEGEGRRDPRCPAAQVRSQAKYEPVAGEGIRGVLANIHAFVQHLLWLLSVIVTGFLIGLGGPYWFDLAMSLSRMRDFLKTGQAKPADKVVPPPSPEALVTKFLEKTEQKRDAG